MKTIKDSKISDYLMGLSDFQREIVLDVRKAILSADVSIKEGIKWGSIAFFNKMNICGFRVAKEHITLLFMEGAMLEDKSNILEGSGNKARTLKITNTQEIPFQAIQDLIKQALSKGM